ncbi:MAG: hypothetical protein K2X27_02245, partial [Candidatus Obscuribacterales bacterium]|nr:hypothetical protein [Candidatus Obscuribacterales bacterium]
EQGGLRTQYGLALYEAGLQLGKNNLKQDGINMLESVESVDRNLFTNSDFIKGALLQMRRGDALNQASFEAESWVDFAAKNLNLGGWLKPNSVEKYAATMGLSAALKHNPVETENIVSRLSQTLSSNDKRLLNEAFKEAKAFYNSMENPNKATLDTYINKVARDLNLGGWLAAWSNEKYAARKSLAIAIKDHGELAVERAVRRLASKQTAGDRESLLKEFDNAKQLIQLFDSCVRKP